MPEPIDTLILDLLEWIGPRARPYHEVIDAWRTSCPRFPVWEDATDRGYLDVLIEGAETTVSVSARGRRFLAEHRHVPHSGPGAHHHS